MRVPVFLLSSAAAWIIVTPARADVAPPQGVLNLSSSATVEVPRDLIAVTLSTTREGTDAGAVQAQLKQSLDAALAEARKVARPGQVDLQTGNFSLSPRYASKGGITGWQGSAELIVEGRDMQAIGQLAGRITTLSVARVAYGLSREVREKAEAEVAGQAIARFRAKAADYSRQLGYTGYVVREIGVNTSEQSPTPLPMRMKAMAAAGDESLPVEAGKGTVVVTVGGTVQMK